MACYIYISEVTYRSNYIF